MDIFYTFNFQQIFLGEFNLPFLLEISFRTLLIFVFLLLISRFFGKKSVSQMNPFDFFLFIALGSALGDPMIYQEVGVLWTVVVIVVVLALYILQGYAAKTSKVFQSLTKNKPVLVIKDGKVQEQILTVTNITMSELLEKLRIESVESTGEIERAYLERSGALSVFKFLPDEKVRGLPTFSEEIEDHPQFFYQGDRVPRDDLYASYNGEIESFTASQEFPEGTWTRAV